ncbi:hypothetical protein AURDEDRAFT_110663 [Auricularia subglabra TFB-10046 SS5]|nr:hypothetical protein AURDEDRAFT_110663 [Auricularia subglabra TFB-10046 SS5]
MSNAKAAETVDNGPQAFLDARGHNPHRNIGHDMPKIPEAISCEPVCHNEAAVAGTAKPMDAWHGDNLAGKAHSMHKSFDVV